MRGPHAGAPATMRHILMASMHGGLGGFMIYRMIRRTVMKLVILGLVVLAVVLWLRLRQERMRRGPP